MASGQRKHARFEDGGSVAFDGIAANPSWTTVLTLSKDSSILFILNTLNKDIQISLPNEDGTSGIVTFPAGSSNSFDLTTNGLIVAAGAIKIRPLSVAPTSGRFSVFGVS